MLALDIFFGDIDEVIEVSIEASSIGVDGRKKVVADLQACAATRMVAESHLLELTAIAAQGF